MTIHHSRQWPAPGRRHENKPAETVRKCAGMCKGISRGMAGRNDRVKAVGLERVDKKSQEGRICLWSPVELRARPITKAGPVGRDHPKFFAQSRLERTHLAPRRNGAESGQQQYG